MNLAHAMILSKLTAENQKIALPKVWHEVWRQAAPEDQGIDETSLVTSALEEDFEEDEDGDGGYDDEEDSGEEPTGPKRPYAYFPDKAKPRSAVEFARWVGSNFLLVVNKAPFDIHSSDLNEGYPGYVGSCDLCPKRTGHNRLLFAEITVDACTDPACFEVKVNTHIRRAISSGLIPVSSQWQLDEENKDTGWLTSRQYTVINPEQTADSEWQRSKFEQSGELLDCSESTTAIVVEGRGDAGAVIKICASLTCTIHKVQKTIQSAVEFSGSNGAGVAGGDIRAKQILDSKIKSATQSAALEAIVEAVPTKVSLKDLQFVALALLGRLQWNQVDAVAAILGEKAVKDTTKTKANMVSYIGSLTAPELPPLIVRLILSQELGGYAPDGIGELMKFAAKMYQVDLKAIQKTVRKEIAEKSKPKKKTATAK